MNVKVTIGYACNSINVTLSRRNLETLLSKLGRGGSACTLFSEAENGWTLIVTAETDELHYSNRVAGAVHPLDEPSR